MVTRLCHKKILLITVLHACVSITLKPISMQNLMKIYMRFKSYEHFHLKTLTGQNDAWQTLSSFCILGWLHTIEIKGVYKI